MLEQFPKQRPPLSAALEEIYSSHYRSNRDGRTPAASWAKRMETWLHRQVARDVADPRSSGKVTLELGAGTLNQLPYEPTVQSYDIVEPFTELYEGSPLLARVRTIYPDISRVPSDCRYDQLEVTKPFELDKVFGAKG